MLLTTFDLRLLELKRGRLRLTLRNLKWAEINILTHSATFHVEHTPPLVPNTSLRGTRAEDSQCSLFPLLPAPQARGVILPRVFDTLSLFCLFFSTQAHTGNAGETHGDLNLVPLTMHLPQEQTGIRGAAHSGSVAAPEQPI